MSAISETYNRGYKILELANIKSNVLSQQVKWNVININGKYELTDELSNDVRPKKTSKLHGLIV